jgi:hypothetical protein
MGRSWGAREEEGGVVWALVKLVRSLTEGPCPANVLYKWQRIFYVWLDEKITDYDAQRDVREILNLVYCEFDTNLPEVRDHWKTQTLCAISRASQRYYCQLCQGELEFHRASLDESTEVTCSVLDEGWLATLGRTNPETNLAEQLQMMEGKFQHMQHRCKHCGGPKPGPEIERVEYSPVLVVR